MSAFLTSARRAFALHRKGKTPVEIKLALGLRLSAEATRYVHCGRLAHGFDEPRLTADEIALLFAVANAERDAVARGDTCAPKLKYCSGGLFWPKSRSAYLAYRRLGSHRRGEDERRPGTGLGLLHPYNGYVRLTRAGWALVHALDAVEASE